MRLLRKLVAITLLAAALPGLADMAIANHQVSQALQKATPAVVNIMVKKQLDDPMVEDELGLPDTKLKSAGLGSGVIINAKQGIIITNDHVVHDAKFILVTLKDGRRYRANLLAESGKFDLAVVQIHADHLTQIQFADSNKAAVGDYVLAIGSPFGLKQTVTSGMISGLNRNHPAVEDYQNFIQTDAPINPGNSGGALVNLQGKLVGINTAILSAAGGNNGIGFAIPSNMVRDIALQLLHYQNVKRGLIGIYVQTLTPNLQAATHSIAKQGALVSEVFPDAPAAKAGIKPMDVITEVDGEMIDNAESLQASTTLKRPGTALTLTVIRGHKTFKATIKTMGINDHTSLDAPLFSGVQLNTVDELTEMGDHIHGIQLLNMKDSSDVSIAGLDDGDVIVAIDQHPVSRISDLQKLSKNKKAVLVKAIHNGKSIYVVVHQ